MWTSDLRLIHAITYQKGVFYPHLSNVGIQNIFPSIPSILRLIPLMCLKTFLVLLLCPQLVGLCDMPALAPAMIAQTYRNPPFWLFLTARRLELRQILIPFAGGSYCYYFVIFCGF
jgi:hypothetical protein